LYYFGKKTSSQYDVYAYDGNTNYLLGSYSSFLSYFDYPSFVSKKGEAFTYSTTKNYLINLKGKDSILYTMSLSGFKEDKNQNLYLYTSNKIYHYIDNEFVNIVEADNNLSVIKNDSYNNLYCSGNSTTNKLIMILDGKVTELCDYGNFIENEKNLFYLERSSKKLYEINNGEATLIDTTKWSYDASLIAVESSYSKKIYFTTNPIGVYYNNEIFFVNTFKRVYYKEKDSEGKLFFSDSTTLTPKSTVIIKETENGLEQKLYIGVKL
jgi:hypothetical protein